jgi:hypothetical protein
MSTSGYDCHIGRAFYRRIMYADDLLIMSPSVGGLQHLLNCCYGFVINCMSTMFYLILRILCVLLCLEPESAEVS